MIDQKKSYSELIKLQTFEERFEYCKTDSKIGVETFGYDRYLNQYLYSTKEWKIFRNHMVLRDKGNDLGIDDGNHEINGIIVLHHINPITVEDVIYRRKCVFDPENVITVWDITHKALHFGSIDTLPKGEIERTMNDTCPWRK